MKNSVLAALLLIAACTEPTAPPAAASAAVAPHVIFPDGFRVTVEVAADDPTREQGLMYRDTLAPDRGMIFLFAQSGDYPFWMKNTLIPLDMIWISDLKRIVHIATAQPCKADPCPNYPPNAKAMYVLEVPAGVAAKHQLKDGALLRFEGLEKYSAR